MNRRKFLLIGLGLMTLLHACIDNRGSEIKKSIAEFDDREILESKVTLYQKGKYYIGYREDVNDAYFLAYSINGGSSYELCKIFTRRNWDKNDSINKLIVEANKKLDAVHLKSSMIYDDIDSLRIVLLDSRNLSINSVSAIKDIRDIKDLNKYTPPILLKK